MLKRLFYASLLLLFILACNRSGWPDPVINKNEASIAFYNVENLFDTIDDPTNPRDEEFLPGSKLDWDTKKYNTKIERIATVIEAMHFPELMGLAEVENENPLRDLIAHEKLSKHNYQIVHENTQDYRGIDCALLYNADFFEVKNFFLMPIHIPDPNYTGREVLFVEGVIRDIGKPMIIAVTHWPSRSGGLQKTEARRISMANQILDFVTRRYDLEEEDFLLMGDLNDEPSNRSIANVLDAEAPNEEDVSEFHLFNMSIPSFREGKGTYNYRGNWNMLDQMIVSRPLMECSDSFCVQAVKIYEAPDLFFNHPRFGQSPDRTAGGQNYYGGYSDHLPIYAPLKLPKKN